MLRITCTCRQDSVTLTLEGKLAGPGVDEAKKAWRSPQVVQAGQRTVNLNGVTSVDEAGKRLLAAMRRHRARFIAEGVFMRHIVRQITNGASRGSGKSGGRKGSRE